MRVSLQVRLTRAFVGLAVGPLLVVSVLAAWQGFSYQQEALRQQQQTAQRVAVEASAFLTGLEDNLHLVIQMTGAKGLAAPQAFGPLFELLVYRDLFEALTFVDRLGQERQRVARLDIVTAADLTNRAGTDEFEIPLTSGAVYYSPVRFDAVTGEPLLTIAVPVFDEQGGHAAGVLVAETRLKKIWELVASISVSNRQNVYIVDEAGRVVAHRNPSVVLRGTRFTPPARLGLAAGLDSTLVVLAAEPIHLGGQTLTIVAEQQLLEAFALPINLVVITLTVTLAALAAAVLVGLRVVRQVVRPVQDLAATARAIRSGDFEQQAPVARDDEVGELAAAFNSMTAQLRDFIGALEQRVQERTAELQKAKAAADAAREAADAANRAKSEFLSSMSHELRTPLNGILGYAQILQRERALTPRQAEGLTIIQQSGEHLLTLINDILDLAKIEARKLELYPAPIHLNGFLQGLVGIAEARAEQKGLAFAYEALTPLPVGVIADDKRLRQILLNLLGNAVKFTDAGRVALRVSARADTAPPDHVALRFEVEDTGPGIPADQLESIFLPFEQTEATRGKIEGTGLGLPISRQFARLMGSDIHVESRPGQGSLFWLEIVLPVAAPLGETRRANEPVIVGYRGPRRKVLVADDKDYNRAVLVDLLAPLGFETLTASDGREAVARARDFKPDVILTDLVMPVMTGVEAAQHIRQIPELRQTVIVAISASVLNVEQQRQQLAGCDGYLPKPVRAEDLYDLLARLLNLEWVREGAAVAAPPPTLPAAPGGEPVALPPAERAALAELARRGDMLKLEQRAAQLAQARPELAPFARELERLARRFEDQQALALIEHCPEAPA